MRRINAEIVQRLDAGVRHFRLVGAEGQRLLAAGLAGAWQAIIEVEGFAGMELAARLNAPGVIVVCHGSAADGAGQSLRAGRLIVLGDTADGLGYAQEGGETIVAGATGARAGLNQSGGVIAVLGTVGRLAGERQSGGRFFAFADRIGPYAGRGHRGGRFLRLVAGEDPASGLASDDAEVFHRMMRTFVPWIERIARGCAGNAAKVSEAMPAAPIESAAVLAPGGRAPRGGPCAACSSSSSRSWLAWERAARKNGDRSGSRRRALRAS